MGELTYESFYRQYEEIRDNLQRDREMKSVYEVGCGSGANLYLFEEEGYACGGLDYSRSLTRIAENVLDTGDIICMEAADLPKPFYTKQFFRDFAKKQGMDIVFLERDMDGYWNNQFVFSCYMYKH